MIYRSKLLGGGAFIAAAALLTLPTADAQVFWTSNSSADIMRANLDGTGVTPVFQRDGNTLGLTGGIIDVAATSTHLYWTENVAGGGGIWRSDHFGNNVTKIVSGSFTGGLQFLVADTAGDRLLFSDWSAGVFSAPLSGGTATPLGNPGATTATSVYRNTGVALAGPNQLLSLAANTNDRNVYSTDINAAANSVLGTYTATASNQSYGIAYHAPSNTVYSSTVNDGRVSLFDLSTNTAAPAAVATLSRALGMDFNPDGSLLYIVSQTNANNTGTPGIYTFDPSNQQLSLWLATDASFGVAVIPEPSTYALLFGLGIGAFLLVRRRIRK
jgi:hypothetical protein